jgi:hypothetical protein
MVGRALGAQGFIFDVLYSKELLDTSEEIYKVKKQIKSFASYSSYGGNDEDLTLPTGVFTITSNCYSYKCTRNNHCYSYSCPNRKDRELSITHTRQVSEVVEAKLWYKTVPKEVLDNVSPAERKRQEVLFEIIQTEKQFLDDLQMIQNVFIKPLKELDIIESSQRQVFINSVFLNIYDIYQTNSKLKRKLLSRQRESYSINAIGDIFASIAEEWYIFVEYGASQAFAKCLVDEEKSTNPKFVSFLKECERKKECRKLPLESFLSSPTTRMGRYPLFLTSSIMGLPKTHPDSITVPQALETIRDILKKINFEAGKAENALKLSRLNTQIVFTPGEQIVIPAFLILGFGPEK